MIVEREDVAAAIAVVGAALVVMSGLVGAFGFLVYQIVTRSIY